MCLCLIYLGAIELRIGYSGDRFDLIMTNSSERQREVSELFIQYALPATANSGGSFSHVIGVI